MSVSTIIWLARAALFGIIEACTVGLVSIWFAVGAIGGLITSAITDNLLIQTAVFVIVTVIALIVTRPLKERISKAHVATNADNNIGRIATIICLEENGHNARAQLDGVDWRVRCDDVLEIGQKCKVLEIDGTTLVVELCMDALAKSN
ncbi:MAG: NfeD family protein [Oscillospiraceae bacterium]